jgi:dihydrofolate reductase
MRTSLIVAISKNNVIGRDGQLPWHLSDDLKRFKRLTMGHHIVMGRKTYESIGRPLPGRTSVVVTRQGDYRPEGVLVAQNIPAAFELINDETEAFVIGGAEIYQGTLARAERIYLTTVDVEITGDAFFSPLAPEDWTVRETASGVANSKNDYPHTFEILDRSSQVPGCG